MGIKKIPAFVTVFTLVIIVCISLKTLVVHNGEIKSDLSQLSNNLPITWPANDVECIEYDRVSVRVQETRMRFVDPSKHIVNELLEFVNFRNVCPQSGSGVVVIVDTARDHFFSRNLIRRTWGSLRFYKDYWVRVIFLMGQSAFCIDRQEGSRNTEEHLKITEEHLTFGDTVIGGFADTYKNMTYKHLMGYKYVLDNCASAKFLIKTDDDLFVDVPQIIDEIEDNKNHKYDMFCDERSGKPVRCTDCAPDISKWFVTEEEWPEDFYPKFCLGGDYIISTEWARNIYRFKNHGGFFWVDDVFITGKLREIAEARLGEETVRRNISDSVSSLRVHREYLQENCKNENVNLGLFIIMSRDWPEYLKLYECFWEKIEKRSILTEEKYFADLLVSHID